MTDSSDTDSDSAEHSKTDSSVSDNPSANKDASLDEAIEYCVRQLETNQNIDPADLVSRFPQWSAELAEFTDNWSGMEQFANALVESDPSPNELTAEESQFGDYELIEKIGAGGMGVIYKARQISLDRIVAIKTVSGQHRDRDRFRIEAEAAASLTHPNIVPIYEIGEHRDRLFFSMRLVEGGSLRELIEQDSFSFREVAKIVIAIARAVGFAHQHGILHRDLKPGNVLMDSAWQPHITDFGLAKQIARDTEITRTGTIMGTPGYMAPEQADGKTGGLTTATDIYGVGAILYALLTGQAPFKGDNSLEVLRRVIDESPTAPRSIRATIPRDLETICLKCLSKEPNARYHSADLMADDLERYLDHKPVKARPITTSERFWRWCRRNPAIALLSGAVALLVVSTTLSSFLFALSERGARLESERYVKQEKILQERADEATVRQAKSAESAIQAQANLCLTNGLWQSKQDNHGEAVLWFAEATRLTKNDPEKLRENQVRCQSWYDGQPVPVAATFMEESFREMANGRKPGQIQFRNNSTELLCQAGSKFVVWDYASDETWQLDEVYPGLTFATWGSRGKLLAIGTDDGSVSVVDSDSRTIEQEFAVDGSVGQLAFSHDSRFLSVATKNSVKFQDLQQQTSLGSGIELEKPVVCVKFGDMSHQFVAVTQDAKYKGTAHVYELADESLQLKFKAHCRADRTTEGRNAHRPQFVANDKFMVFRSNENKPEEMIWVETKSGDVVRSVPLNTHKFAVDVSKDGEHVITGDEKNAVARWFVNDLESIDLDEAGTGSETAENKRNDRESADQRTSTIKHTDRVNTVDISGDGLVATGGWDFVVQLWTFEDYLYGTASAQRLRRLAKLPHQSRIRNVKFSPDDSRLVTVQVDGLIRVWQLPERTFREQSVPVPASGSLAKIIDRQHWMVSGMPRWVGAMSNVSVFNTNSGDLIGGTWNLSLEDHGCITDSCALPNENLLISAHASPGRSRSAYRSEDGSPAGSIRFWNLSDGLESGEPLELKSEPRWIAKHPAGDQIAVCLANLNVLLLDPQSMEIKDTLKPTGESSVANDGSDFGPRGTLRPTHRCNQQAAYSPNGKLLAVWSATQVGLWVWDIESRELCFSQVGQDLQPINRVDFSPSGDVLAVAGGRNNNVRILNARSGQPVVSDFKHTSVVYNARFSSDGTKVVVASRDGLARIFDAKTGELLLDNLSHPTDVVNAAFTPDSKYVLTLGFDQLRVWHSSDGSLAMKPVSIPDRSRQMHITFDSRYVIIAGGQSEVVVFDLDRLQQVNLSDINQLKTLGELLSGRTISQGSVRNLATQEWFEHWTSWREKKE